MPGGPTGDRGHRRQWRKVGAQEGERIDTDGGAGSGRRKQSTGRKRDRPRREGVTRGSDDLSEGWYRVPPWAVTETERHQEVTSAARAWEEAEGPGWNSVSDAQWGRGEEQRKRHCSGNWQATVPSPRRQEVRKRRRGGRGTAAGKKGGEKRGGMGKDETRTPRAMWETSPARRTGQQTWSGVCAWPAIHAATSVSEGRGTPNGAQR